MTEQLLIDILFFIIYELFNCSFIYIHLICTLTPRYNKWLILAGCSCGNWIAGKILLAIGNIPLRFVCSILAVIIPAMLFFKDKWQKKLLSATIQLGAFMLFDAIVATLAVEYFGFISNAVEVKTWECVFQALIFDSICAFMLVTVIVVWRKFINKMNISIMSLFIIFPVGQAVAVSGYYNHIWENINGVEKMNPFLIVSVVVFVISDVFMFIAMKSASKMADMKIKLNNMEHEMELQYRYYESISNQFEEIREYRHDIRNLLAAVEMVISDKSSYEAGAEMLDTLRERADTMNVPIICKNPIVNAVIWRKSKEAQEKTIDFVINISTKEELNIEKTDICSVVANLLDNAIREAENHKDSFVEISAKTDLGMVLVEVKNTTDKIIDYTESLETTKNGKGHGHGMEIVDKIARKYNGSFVFRSDGKTATASFGAVISSV